MKVVKWGKVWEPFWWREKLFLGKNNTTVVVMGVKNGEKQST